ncbi:hypothetical protein HID58_086975 [Brassica napus]|uniref:Uncharacterized protein n=1 Tax=Brassica napus TaxID=3708 RepID=A0ABQ7XS29_BRANA|nr:hypothetical protein HID58_086975 [Brassica napus]
MASPLIGPPELRDSKPLLPKPIIASGSIFSSEGPNREWSGHVPLRRQSLPRLLLPRCSQHAQEICGSEERLQLAWDHDPLITLKLICNLRGVRGTGKSDKEGFYTAALWLHGSHPKTLACNLESLSKFGYFKDFPEILDRILKGSKIRDTQKSEWMQRKSCRGRGRRVDGFISKTGQGSRKRKTAATREVRVATAEMKNQADKAIASINRKLEKISMGKEAFTRYSHDAEYRFLHERTLQLPEVYMGAKEWGSLPYNRVASVAMKSYKEIFLSHDEESDMEFDEASSSYSRYNTRETSSWETNYQVIVSKYKERGYGVPEIVFWNLRDSKSTPVARSDKGVALVSGFSKNLIKMFLDNDGEIDPMTIMDAVISGPEYNELVVID